MIWNHDMNHKENVAFCCLGINPDVSSLTWEHVMGKDINRLILRFELHLNSDAFPTNPRFTYRVLLLEKGFPSKTVS